MIADLIAPRLAALPGEWLDRRYLRSRLGDLTFGQAQRSALHFANWLRKCAGVQPGDPVALCLPRSLEAVQAILGVLVAGGAYAPIAYNSPPQRLFETVQAVGPRILLTTATVRARLATVGSLPPLAILEARPGGAGLQGLLDEIETCPLIAVGHRHDLAAIYFTSGSTGLPKGVMMSQEAMAGMASWIARWNGMTATDCLASDAGLHYATAFDLLTPLYGGGSTFLIDDRDAMFPERVAEAIESEKASVWCSSATSLRLLLERGSLERRNLATLRRVEFFGEPLSPVVLRRLMEILPQAELVNFYGATEAHRIASYTVPRPLPESLDSVPVGWPADSYALSLRDEDGREVGAGETGEICVTGPRTFLGYWKDEAQTLTKRVSELGQSYRTGDLARFEEDGLLHLIGRRDQEVKLRGNRFDLGEVETVLKILPEV